MMKRLLVFQHVPYEILGNLDPLLREAGFRIRYINFGREPEAQPNVSRYDGLIVLGGPMNCDQHEQHVHLHTEIEAIRQAIDEQKPVLGICLGAQLIARALGAEVMPNKTREIGWYPLNPTDAGKADPLFGQLDTHQMIFQWHGDTFMIPEEAVHLATSPDCQNQAFRYGNNVYGLQFHLEVDEPMIMRWLKTPSMAEEALNFGGPDVVEQIAGDTSEHIEHSVTLGNRLFSEFIRLSRTRTRKKSLPSR
jgi:GMP synthase (glutamine-hydrolysing)